MTTAAVKVAEIGDNNPPNVIADVRASLPLLMPSLEIANTDLTERLDDLLKKFGAVPESIDDEENAHTASELVKQLRTLYKDSEGRRSADKDPFLKAGASVDGFYKNVLMSKAEATGKTISNRLTAYQNAVIERRRREAAAAAEELRRKEAEERAAAEAERAKKEAEAAALRAQEEALRKQAEAVAANMSNKAELRTAVAIEAQANFVAKVAERTEAAAQVTPASAIKVGAEAAKMERLATSAKPADLSRTRASTGALLTTKKETVIEIADDLSGLDFSIIKPFIKRDAIEAAIRLAVRQGVKFKDDSGVRVYEQDVASVR